jgi:thiamine-monophosphate kinase
LIATYFAPLAGPGAFGLRDDAAVLAQKPGHDIVATKDMLIAGVHLFTDDPPGAVARKALRVNLSDLSARGAEPPAFSSGLPCRKIGRRIGSRVSRKGSAGMPRPTNVRSWAATP